MSLKRRDLIAYLLILLSAALWASGQYALQTARDAEDSWYDIGTTDEVVDRILPTAEVSPDNAETKVSAAGIAGYALCAVSAGAAVAGVFVLFQKSPLLGPDGASALAGVYVLIAYAILDYFGWFPGYFFRIPVGSGLSGIVFLTALRELWGWIMAKLSPSWCAVYRLHLKCRSARLSLASFLGLSALSFGGMVLAILRYRFYALSAIPCCAFGISAILGLVCLFVYGGELDHFKKQLENYKNGLPIEIREGSFSNSEAMLSELKAQQEEAIKTAVTSERFKVELISNVSHDLRTPLTSILGYGELLQKEPLSPEGRERLHGLCEKAGYMSELVESVFELTKVSSGVSEPKREEIDLVRLLEQTLGLFDDQLMKAGLTVKRGYPSESIPMVTDGVRMHEVFANLLGNAIKYSLPGTRIYLNVRETQEGVAVRMVNTASYEMDFAPEEIVQRFARGDKARSTKGSGLGLAIAQTYTQSVGGSFKVCVDGDQFSAVVELPRGGA